jgi:hypothetical protein
VPEKRELRATKGTPEPRVPHHETILAHVAVGKPDIVLSAFDAAGAAVGLPGADVDGLKGGSGGDEGREEESSDE